MMQLKEYQRNTLDAFSRWLETLEKEKDKSNKGIEALEQAGIDIPDDLRNYPKKAWDQLKENSGVAPSAGDYVSRTDEVDRPIPHICFKVPTRDLEDNAQNTAYTRFDTLRGAGGSLTKRQHRNPTFTPQTVARNLERCVRGQSPWYSRHLQRGALQKPNRAEK